MNTKSFFFLIMGNLGQWRTKVDKTTKTGCDKAVAWEKSGKGEKEGFTVRVSPFSPIYTSVTNWSETYRYIS